MQLVINSYGAALRKKDGCFQVYLDGEKKDIAIKKVDSILISTSAVISTDAIEIAMQNNIDIVFMDKFGDPFGRVWHSKLGSTTLIRRRQLEIAETKEGLLYVNEWLEEKVENQIALLKKLKSQRRGKEELFDEPIKTLEEGKEKIALLEGTVDEIRHRIMGTEGTLSRTYFKTINSVMPRKFQFDGRSRQPAEDPFNALLNYGYGILYSKVEKAAIIAGLDPYVGVLHTDNYNKKSFVFDFIEKFRGYVDENVIYLLCNRKINDAMFDTIPKGMALNKEGRKVLIARLNEAFEKKQRYRGRNIAVKDIIPFEAHRFANLLIEKK